MVNNSSKFSATCINTFHCFIYQKHLPLLSPHHFYLSLLFYKSHWCFNVKLKLSKTAHLHSTVLKLADYWFLKSLCFLFIFLIKHQMQRKKIIHRQIYHFGTKVLKLVSFQFREMYCLIFNVEYEINSSLKWNSPCSLKKRIQ